LPAAGFRGYDGSLYYAGSHGICWSSSVLGTNAYSLYFDGSGVRLGTYYPYRSYGFSLRCVAE
jgi:hypothetical protein